MARRKTPTPATEPIPGAVEAKEPAVHRPPAAPRVLIVSGSRLERMRLATKLGDTRDATQGQCAHADSAKAALRAVEVGSYDLALIRCDLPDGTGADLALELSRRVGAPLSILMADNPTVELAVQAMRSGAADLVAAASHADLIASMRSVFERARALRDREARIERLTRVCRKLNQARHEVTRQVSSLCGDMVDAYQELSGQVLQISIASEFNSLIRQELDVESLLRTSLEFILAKTGPTNAAVFLPATSSDFSLGAYVNYDCPKDAADVLLEHLAGIVAPRMEGQTELKVFSSDSELRDFMGDDAHWLEGSNAIAFACHQEDECLAVVILFRDRRSPFAASLLPGLRIISELFGKQLGRVIHIHHRHLPKDKWGGFGTDEGEDDIDLAA